MKRGEWAIVLVALVVLTVPAVRSWITSHAELTARLAPFEFDGRRYLLVRSDETTWVSLQSHPNLEAARTAHPGLKAVERLSHLDANDVLLMQLDGRIVEALFLFTDGTFIKMIEPGVGTVLYKRDYFDATFTGLISRPSTECRP